MSWGVALRNAIGLGLGGIPSLRNAPPYAAVKFLFAETGVLDPRITFTRTTTGTYVNSSGIISSAAVNEPRFDYDPVTLAARGLLIEEQRTNLCLYSSDLTNVTWVYGANAVLTGNTTSAPDGTTTADTITVNGTNNGVYQIVACTASTTYHFSLYVKLGTMGPGDYKIAVYDNTNSAFIAADIVPTQTPSSTAWTRVTYTFTTPATCVSVRVYCFRNALSANTSVNVWGMQLEQASFATSYIPTTTAAITRAADVASVTGANFSSWYNPVEGTTYVEASTWPSVTAAALTHAISDGTFNQSIYGNFNAGNLYIGANVLNSGVNQASGIGSFSITASTNTTKDAFAYKQNNFGESCNGATPKTDSTGTVPTVDRLYIGTNWAGNANFLNGHIRSFAYYNTRLSNATLQSLTAVPAWTPAQLTTALWFDAADAATITLNGSNVSQWNDKSGNGRNVVQATAANQPTYSATGWESSKPAIVYDNKILENTTATLKLITRSMFVVVRETTRASSAGVFTVKTSGNDYDQPNGYVATTGSIGVNSFELAGSSGISYRLSASPDEASFGIYGEVKQAGLGSLYRNGTLHTTDSSFVEFTTDSVGGFRVGGRYSAYGLTGNIAEVIYLESTASTTNRQLIEGYLAWKWGGA